MDKLPINLVDLAVLAIVLISAVFAFLRGFVKEVLSILGWIGAAFAALYLFSPLAPIARGYLAPTLLADAVTGVVIFVVALLILSMISHAIAARVRGSALSALDRSLGFLFGVLRGAVIVAMAYLVVAWLVPTADQPQVLRQAKALPLVSAASDVLISLLPQETRERVRDAVGTAAARAKDAADTARTLDRLTNTGGNPSTKPDSGSESGYKDGERRSLDNLIRNSQGTDDARRMIENAIRSRQITSEQRQMLEGMIRNHQVSADEQRALEDLLRNQRGQ